MSNILSIIALLFINFTFGQSSEINNENESWVINILGAKVYEKPTFESKILNELPVGKSINPERIIETDEVFNIGDKFSLKGNWIKAKKINGFIFSSDLTDKNVEIGKNEHGKIFINLLGKLIDERGEKKLVKTKKGEFPKYFEYKHYENATYTSTAWDGCFDHLTEYKDLNLNEVYHQMISDYAVQMNENDCWIPEFLERSGNTIKFKGVGATEDLKIEVKESGNYTISSYDCN